jgi:hypothetical protein
VYNHPSTQIPAGGPLPVEFLDGDGGYGGNSTMSKYWRTYNKLSGMSHPSPANLWVITDENPFSINDPLFAIAMDIPDANGNPTATHIVSTPASYHDGADSISFADGHSEMHKWIGSTIKITSIPLGAYQAGDSLQDLRWLQARTTATK